MTVFVPTHRVDVLRGTTTDAYGDPADAEVVVAHGVPVLITEAGRAGTSSAKAEQGPVTTTPRTIRRLRGRFRPGVEVRTGDRWRDCSSGDAYQVTGVSSPTHVVGIADTLCDLVRVTPIG